jgi:hypothetical protein
MPSRRTILVVGSVLVGVALLAFFLGRTTAPTKVHETVKTVAIEKRVEVEKKVEVAAAEQEAKEVVRWRTKVIVKTDGTRIEVKEVERADEKRDATRTEKSAERTVVQVQEKLVYKDLLVEAAAPGFAFGVAVGAGTDLRMRYQGDVAYRLVGGLWLTVAFQVEREPFRPAALAGVRFTF